MCFAYSCSDGVMLSTMVPRTEEEFRFCRGSKRNQRLKRIAAATTTPIPMVSGETLRLLSGISGFSKDSCMEKSQFRLPSAAESQAMSQRFRQTRGAHAPLHLGDIIWHAPEFDSVVIEVRNGKAGARITISRLANRTGVQQIAFFFFDLQSAMHLIVSRVELQHFELRIQIRESTLMMRVAVEGYLRCGIEQSFQGLRRCEHIFILILE